MKNGTCTACGFDRPLTRTRECRACAGRRVGRAGYETRQAGEPTEAELDAMIAEQLPTMPGHEPKPPRQPRGPMTMPRPAR